MLRTRSLIRLIAVLAVFALAIAAGADDPPPVFQPEPRPLPSALQVEAGLRLELYFTSLIQGGVGLMRLTGDGITEARFSLDGSDHPFFARSGSEWIAFAAVDMDRAPRRYPLVVRAWRGDEVVRFQRELQVDDAGHYTQPLELSPERAYLARASVETAEFARLADIIGTETNAPLWDARGFELPLDSALATPFGVIRVLPDGRRTRHTGWDQLAAVGTPVRAMAAGRVVWSERMEIRGNAIIIDHGLGLFSLYAHLSDRLALTDQMVAAGQIIGKSGNTGRSSAPHLHWEIMLGGRWIDGKAALALWLPS